MYVDNILGSDTLPCNYDNNNGSKCPGSGAVCDLICYSVLFLLVRAFLRGAIQVGALVVFVRVLEARKAGFMVAWASGSGFSIPPVGSHQGALLPTAGKAGIFSPLTQRDHEEQPIHDSRL